MQGPVAAPQKKSGLTKMLIGCGALFALSLPVCGILAAIAVPAFQRSINKSKEAEAIIQMNMLVTNAEIDWLTDCAFAPALAQTGDPKMTCGETHVPTINDPEALGTMGSLDGAMYFIYSTEVTPQGGDEVMYTIRAQHDFDCGSPEVHTTEIVITGTKDADGTCTTSTAPAFTLNEFE